MAAGRAAYRVRITRAQNQVLIETAIDGVVKSEAPLSEMTPQALRAAVAGVSRETKSYAATHNVNLDVEIINEASGHASAFAVNPAGEITNKSNRTIETQSARRTASAPATRVAAKPAGSHRAPSSFSTVTALPSRPVSTPPRAPEPEPEPEPALAWAESAAAEPEVIAPAKPDLVPVTDRKVRIKKPAKGDGEQGSLVSELTEKFKGLSTIKKVGVVFAAVIVLFLGARIVGGGGGEYTALCVDQRTGLVNLDPAPCQASTVRFFVWYYVDAGETMPEPGTDYSVAPGSFDKPTSGTITYP